MCVCVWSREAEVEMCVCVLCAVGGGGGDVCVWEVCCLWRVVMCVCLCGVGRRKW